MRSCAWLDTGVIRKTRNAPRSLMAAHVRGLEKSRTEVETLLMPEGSAPLTMHVSSKLLRYHIRSVGATGACQRKTGARLINCSSGAHLTFWNCDRGVCDGGDDVRGGNIWTGGPLEVARGVVNQVLHAEGQPYRRETQQPDAPNYVHDVCASGGPSAKAAFPPKMTADRMSH